MNEQDTDRVHTAALQRLHKTVLVDESKIGEWARIAEHEPDKAYEIILAELGYLPVNKSWSVFAPIYNEDTPDSIFSGVAEFTSRVFGNRKLKKSDLVVDVACGTGAISRNLVKVGYGNVHAFDESQAMLSEANRLNSSFPEIHTFKASIQSVRLPFCCKRHGVV